MSWNGATEVATWELFAGTSAAHPALGGPTRRGAASRRRSTAPGVPRFVQVRARDAAGNVLSTSAPTRVRG